MLVQVALPVPLYREFDYRIDDQLLTTEHTQALQLNDPSALIGRRLLVPFGPRKCVGIITNVEQAVDYDESKIKNAIRVLDSEPVIASEIFKLATWLSDFYLHPFGEVLFTLLPALLRKDKQITAIQEVYLTRCDVDTDDSETSSKVDTQLSRSKQQRELYELLEQCDRLAMHEVKKQFSASVINALIKKCLVEKISQELAPLSWQSQLVLSEKPRPNVEQAMAIATITEASGFNTFLLEGVTGSGKTEVYLQIIEPLLLQGKQVLILVPEIGLTPQTVARFEARFGISVGVLHSNLNDTERAQVWRQAKNGELGIIIGTRSSVFTPLLVPAMIIVDEEHDESFKQQDGLRYHARDVAAFRAKQLNIPLVLGTATPSLESLHNALSNKYRHLPLKNRAGKASMPVQKVMDMRNQPIQFGIAQGMLEKIQGQLDAGNQVMVFVNRRGFAPTLICHSCGHVEECSSCATAYTVHKSTRNLKCHRCGDAKYIPRVCGACGHYELTTEGLGTEQIQQGLEQLFPDYKSIRIDSDSVRGKGKLAQLLTQINDKQFQLLIGTQILSKGHHFPNVTMVLILNVDGALFSADFRAPEKLAQLITQLAGRAGRSDKPGEMWLQTHNPHHPLLQDLINNGYADFARYSLLERKHALLPPYEFQVAMRAESEKSTQAEYFLRASAAIFEQFQRLRVIGPFPAFIEKKQGRYRFILIVQSASRNYLKNASKQVLEHLNNDPQAKRLKWILDVNPIDFS